MLGLPRTSVTHAASPARLRGALRRPYGPHRLEITSSWGMAAPAATESAALAVGFVAHRARSAPAEAGGTGFRPHLLGHILQNGSRGVITPAMGRRRGGWAEFASLRSPPDVY